MMEPEPEPRRPWSRVLPRDLSELMNTLIRCANKLIRQFESSEDEMRRIVGELKDIAGLVGKMHEVTDAGRRTGTTVAGVGLGLGILFAPLTFGMSLGLGMSAAAGGGASAVASSLTKARTEKQQAERVKELGKDFMNIVEPMKRNLEEIKTTCEMFEEKSRNHPAEKTLRNTEEFTDILRRVSELKTQSGRTLEIVTAALTLVDGLLELIVAKFRVTSTPEKDENIRASIAKSADQCKQVIDELEKMKDRVQLFTEQ